MSQDNKKDNVVGIGHNSNSNEYGKEQYAKLVNSLHRMLKYSRQELNRVERFLDQAFTKYPFSNPNQPKLKEHKIHESRAEGMRTARKYRASADERIEEIEARAKALGIELELNAKESEASDEVKRI